MKRKTRTIQSESKNKWDMFIPDTPRSIRTDNEIVTLLFTHVYRVCRIGVIWSLFQLCLIVFQIR